MMWKVVSRCSAGLIAMVVVCLATGCGRQDAGKMPITTSSETAREDYLRGRDLAERLRGQEAREYFERAVEADTTFAIAYLQLAFAQPTPGEFFSTFERAKALIDKVSEGEALWIRAAEAGASGFPMKQRDLLRQLVALYPDDVKAFLDRGGMLAWGIVPNQEEDLPGETANSLVDRLDEHIGALDRSGVSYRLQTERCLVTPACTLSSLSVEGAAFALELLVDVSRELRKRYVKEG